MKTKVLIGVPTSEVTRHSNFYDYYNQIERIDNTLHMFARGQSPAKNRNLIIQAAIDNHCTHILFLDDDMCPKPDILTKLLAHDKDVVSGLYPMRNFPHYPVVFDKLFANGFNRHVHMKPEISGLIPITNCGFGCVLIKIEVFEALPKPWVTLGELEADGWCDDIAFFNKVAKAGFGMYCDTDVIVDHMMTVHVGFKRKEDNTWRINYDCRGQGNAEFEVSYPVADVDLARRIEGWMSDKELDFLGVSGKNFKNILEVGSYKGKSTRAFADNNADGKIICIDPWGVVNYGGEGSGVIYETNEYTFESFKKNLKEYIESGKVIPYKMTYDKYEPNGFRPDFIFLDGDHRYEAVIHDIHKSVGMGPKVLAGHDYDKVNWPGVYKAVNETFPVANTVETIWWVELEEKRG